MAMSQYLALDSCMYAYIFLKLQTFWKVSLLSQFQPCMERAVSAGGDN